MGMPTGGHQQAFDHHRFTTAQLDGEPMAVVPDGPDDRLGPDIDALGPEDLGQQPTGLGLLGPGQVRSDLQHGHLGAEAAKHLGHLDTGGPSSEHGEGGGDLPVSTASRLVQYGVPANPATGGIQAHVPM